MAYNYEDNIPQWGNEGTEPHETVRTEGYKPGYKPPASYFNWFWSHVLKWLNDLRTKLSSLHTQVGTLETKVETLENKDYDITASSVLTKIKTVDGEGSGLDADTLDGKHAADFAYLDHTHSQYALTSHTHQLANENQNGFMSSEAYNKLNQIDLDNMTTYTHPATHPASMITGLATVATTGNYADLVNKPVLSAVATSNDYNDLINKPAAYTHPTTHPASMIEETESCKIMTAEERAKLAAIEAQANNYVHPATHPASMITGLEELINSLGYGKVAIGEYLGSGEVDIAYVTSSNPKWGRKITLPFTPRVIIFFQKSSNSITQIVSGQGQVIERVQSGNAYCYGYLENNIFYAYIDDGVGSANSRSKNRLNLAGYTYYWMAF